MNLFKSKASIGILAGIVVAFFVTFGGWAGLFWLLLFSIVGGVIGAQLDGRIDVGEMISNSTGRGRS